MYRSLKCKTLHKPTTLVTRVGKIHFIRILSLLNTAVLTKHFHLTQVFIYHFLTLKGGMRVLTPMCCRYYGYDFMFLAVFNIICPWL